MVFRAYINPRAVGGPEMNGSQASPDLNAILTQVRTLEADKEKMQKLVEQAQAQLQEVQKREAESQAKVSKLSEGKRLEMQKTLQGVIQQWLKESVDDETVRTEFSAGLDRLAQDAQEESGVWKLVCCASNVHAKRMQEIEELREECNSLKEKGRGKFDTDTSRKRGHSEITPAAATDIWGQFEDAFRQNKALA